MCASVRVTLLYRYMHTGHAQSLAYIAAQWMMASPKIIPLCLCLIAMF